MKYSFKVKFSYILNNRHEQVKQEELVIVSDRYHISSEAPKLVEEYLQDCFDWATTIFVLNCSEWLGVAENEFPDIRRYQRGHITQKNEAVAIDLEVAQEAASWLFPKLEQVFQREHSEEKILELISDSALLPDFSETDACSILNWLLVLANKRGWNLGQLIENHFQKQIRLVGGGASIQRNAFFKHIETGTIQ